MSASPKGHSLPPSSHLASLDSERPSPLQVADTGHASSNLCDTCSSLPLQAVLEGVTPSINLRIKIADVGTYYRKQPAYPRCPLCRLLCGSRIEFPDLTKKLNNDQGGEELVALSFLRHCYNTIGHETPASCGNDSIMLTLAPSGFHRNDFRLLPSVQQALEQGAKNRGCLVARRSDSCEPPAITARIVSRQFDRLLARSWITYCQHHHKPLCSKTGGEVAGLRLIDYHSLEVMPAPKHAPYVALSYVWGYHQTAKLTLMSGGNTSIDGMASLPITIADAIRVTIKLGFRYLWVDLYCIDQDNETDGDHHMAQMNMIYHNAELTIIAAARNSAEYGLPGVEYRPRSIRQFAKVGNIEIVPTMRHPHAAIQTSKWSKRAWTFQEGILSRRRLVFTDDQMYFECDDMNCYESVTNVPERNDHWTAFEYCKQIKSSLDELHAPNKLEFDRTLRAGILGWNDKQHFGQPNRSGSHAAFVRFLEMVQVYSAKELWEPSDALRAFDGITSKFEALPDRVDQIWGIPFYRDEEKTLEETFVAGLAWNHAGRAGYDIERLPQPRFICPTWSWMNWGGEAEYGEYDLYKGGYKSAFKSAVASVVLYARDGSLLTLSEYRQKLQSGISRSDIPKTVRIHAWVLPASAFAVEGSVLTLFRKPTNIHVSTADYPERPSLLDLTQEDTKFTKHWKCIYLGSVENKKICLVIRWWSIGWERIALLFTWGNEVDEWCQYMPRRALRLI